MGAKTYEIVEKDEHAQRGILCSLVETPTHGVAYMLMMRGESMSASDITDSLKLSSSHYVRQFNEAVVELETSGLIKEIESGPTDETCRTIGVGGADNGVWEIATDRMLGWEDGHVFHNHR